MNKCLNVIGILLVLLLFPYCGRQEARQMEGQSSSAHAALAGIDTLMWHHPDSALAVMMEFAGSETADSLDVFEGHYCQVLVAELLYKNDYWQSNRKELLKAVHYFDSIVGMDGADARGVSVRERDVFLAARAHYMNGVGFYERYSVVAACGEYLKALEMVETHFPGIETRHGTSLQPNHLPRFMALTYGRHGQNVESPYKTILQNKPIG